MTKKRKSKNWPRFIDLFSIGALIAMGLLFLCIHLLVLLYGEVTLVEPNRVIIGLEITLLLFVIILGLNLFHRLEKSKGLMIKKQKKK